MQKQRKTVRRDHMANLAMKQSQGHLIPSQGL